MSLLFVPKLEGESIGLFMTVSERCSECRPGDIHHALSLLEEETTMKGEKLTLGWLLGSQGLQLLA